ncbi:MAG: cupin domain-containing protein [Gammaproteobacteria bacterium]|nr:MAG: cupin domain-containing protein [Gammaproteobacteria bacterium]TDJ32364.1 MAG: cupin domain-containing protein [Gammaproteobacteria bacterium]
MIDDKVGQRGTELARRQILEPGEASPWHVDPYHRFSVVIRGSELKIEYRDGDEDHLTVTPGEAGWEEPSDRVHRAVNVGIDPYEEVTLFFLDQANSVPQPQQPDR